MCQIRDILDLGNSLSKARNHRARKKYSDIEYTALKMLTAAEETQRKQGVSLWLVGLNPVCCKLSKGRL